jgi:hypothetical protein
MELISSTSEVVGFIGGYGSGKTEGGAHKSVQLACVNPGEEGMIVAPTYKMLVRVTRRAFERVAKRAGIIKRHWVADSLYELTNGSLVWYGSCDNPTSLEGSNLAWGWMDEARLAKRVAYEIMLGRMRVASAVLVQLVLTTTPKAGGWLQDEFDSNTPGRQIIRASSRENFFLKKGFIDNLLRTYSAAQVRAYVDGEFVTLTGSVYPEFDPLVHVVDYEPDPDLPVIAGLDFGVRWPAVVYAQRLESHTMFGNVRAAPGSIVVFDEDMIEGIATEGLGMRIVDWVNGSGLSIDWIACDPAGAIMTARAAIESGGITDVTSLRDVLRANGLGDIRLRYAYGTGSGALRSINTGIEKVRSRLLNARGDVGLFFARSMQQKRSARGLLRAIPSFAYREGTSIPMRGESANQIDHALDALRYLIRHLDLKQPRVEQWA